MNILTFIIVWLASGLVGAIIFIIPKHAIYNKDRFYSIVRKDFAFWISSIALGMLTLYDGIRILIIDQKIKKFYRNDKTSNSKRGRISNNLR